ncbi:hypothetical protein G7Y89_g9752 [Cudoniella acicularis]|uniref:ATPase AAA-type core domain-containing protein n=1 Tax=Cudoniella acicularis TaxID=354080 RepID=A0A8H4RE22_9HELO|nr:hypothetical protein G7Y89_g9752 [Cudoniella acicularis]
MSSKLIDLYIGHLSPVPQTLEDTLIVYWVSVDAILESVTYKGQYTVYQSWLDMNARSSLVTTDLASSLNRSRNDRSNGRDENKKTLYYTPWNRSFFLRYKGRRLMFRRYFQAREFSSREDVSISCFSRSPQILRELLDECYTDLNIYILSLSTINEASLKSLFDKLLSRYIILLEDIDASKSASRKVSLSALLNVIDGVGSQEGRILIMTTNHITRLDEALIRPGRMDKKVELRLADYKMTADLFCLVFKPIVTTEYAQQFFDILKSLSTKQGPPPPPAAIDKVESEELKARASTLEFKKVNEDKKEYKYKVVESLTLPDKVNKLDHYIFVVRIRISGYEFGEEKKTKDRVEYFYVKARYLDFDGKIFRETSSEYAIEKFREKHVKAKLSEYGQIDDAIASRIHFKLNRDAFDDWVRKERNGREIKNLVSTAHALAIQEGCQVTMSHLEVAIGACEDFECDFKGAGPKEAMNGYF